MMGNTRQARVTDIFTEGGMILFAFDEDAADNLKIDTSQAHDEHSVYLDYTKLDRLIEWLTTVRRDMKVRDDGSVYI